MTHLPFPSNQNQPGCPKPESPAADYEPWKTVHPGEPIPMMFRVHMNDGKVLGYAYSDLRETRLLDAGHLQLGLYGMEKYQLAINGRHLSELATLLGLGRIKAIAENDPRCIDRPEAEATIDEITVVILS